MSDPKEYLKSVVHDLINGRAEQAEVTIHNYLVAKTQDVSGLAAAAVTADDLEEVTEE